MKKLQLVELGIIATALIMGYKMITSLLTLMTSLLFGLGTGIGGESYDGNFANRSVLCILYDHLFLLARNIKPLARFICRDNEELLEFKLNKAAVLHVDHYCNLS